MQSIARDAVKMFEGEAKAAGIGLEFHVEDSCNQSNIDYVSLDPTRVLQILIVGITTVIGRSKLTIYRTSSPTLSSLPGLKRRERFQSVLVSLSGSPCTILTDACLFYERRRRKSRLTYRQTGRRERSWVMIL